MLTGSWIDGAWTGEGPDPATPGEALRRGHRIVKRAGEDSAEARERLSRERAELHPDQWTLAHWRSKGDETRVAQGLPPVEDPAVLREAGRRLVGHLT